MEGKVREKIEFINRRRKVMTSELVKRAWHIRRVSARRLGVGVMEVLWGECLAWAKRLIEQEKVNAKRLVVVQTRADQPRPGLVTRVVRRLQGWRF